MEPRTPPRPPSFIGRGDELRLLEGHVEAGARLIVVTGPAGVGKSQLVEQWARTHIHEGRSFARADLGHAVDIEGALRRIGRALELSFGPKDDTEAVSDRIGQALAGRAPALLALDDVDAVIESVGALIERWRETLSGVAFVLSTRRARIDGEHVTLSLGPLPRADAMALLVARAQRVRPDFVVSDKQRGSVAALVERVDALPLGIELLAPRLRLLSPARLLARLEGVAGPIDALRHALDRSFDLLTPWERSALAQCTVFRDGFYLEAAEAVVALPDGAPDVLTVLESLVDQSLLRTGEVAELPDEVRLRFFGAVRERAAEELGGEEKLRAEQRHAAWLVDAAERWDAGIESPDEVEHTARLVVELPNLEAAYGRAEGARTKARLGLVLHMAYQRRGPFSRQGERAEEARALAEELADDRLIARTELALARTERWADHLEESDAALERAMDAAKRAGDVETEAGCARNFAATRWRVGDLEGFERWLNVALEVAGRSGRLSDEVNARNGLGYLYAQRGEIERAREELERALRLAQDTRIPGLVALAHGSLASMMSRAERFEAAERHASAAIDAYAALGYLRQWALELLVRAECRLYEDDLAGAQDDAVAALERARWLGLDAPLTRALGLRGKIAFFEQDWGAARDMLEDAASRLGDHPDALRLQAYAAAARAMLGHLESARETFAETGEDEVAVVLAGFLIVGAAKAAATRGDPVSLSGLPSGTGDAEAHRVGEVLSETVRAIAPGRKVSGVRLEVQEDGRWFRLEGGDGVDLTRRRALRGVLHGLVERATAQPGTPMSLDDVLDAGWPGERMSPESGARRVYVTINRLRKLGLGELLQTTGDGYMLASRVDVVRV